MTVETVEVGPDLVHQQPTSTEIAPATGAADLDSWVRVVGSISKLAAQIADTDFVPKALRGNPAGVTAAMLSGRELGVPPMTALGHIHVIHGKPGLSAQLMRSLIQREGHEISWGEITDTRAVIRGRRRGTTDWVEASFTADDAKTAGINLGGYPQDKLVARATSRLARRLFADVLGGMAYTPEELAEIPDRGPAPRPQPAPRPVDTSAARAAIAAQRDTRPEPPPPVEDPALVSRDQLTRIHATLTSLGLGQDRDLRREQCAEIIGRPLTSGTEMTRDEASQVIDHLDRHGLQATPQQEVQA